MSEQGESAVAKTVKRVRGYRYSLVLEGIAVGAAAGLVAVLFRLAIQGADGLRGQAIDAAQIPDMVPALSVCAALSRGETRICNAQRLRLKESDRLAAMEQALTALGGKVQATADGLVIQGVETLSGGLAQGANDHRVVMALAAAALGSRGPVTVTDAWSIRKSYQMCIRDRT